MHQVSPGLIQDPVVVEQINLPPFTTLQPALSRVAGVQVTPYSGAPGAWSTVRIRGIANATGSSQPLYVVDGVPVYNLDATPERWTGPNYPYDLPSSAPTGPTTPFSPVSNPLLDMPVEDIAQIEVVKGAAATAQYGAQGTNGVIRISTRRGAGSGQTAQKLRVRYAGWAGVQQVRQRYELLNARQYADLVNVAAANNNQPAPYSAADLSGLAAADQQDEVFRVAGIQSHNLSLEGLTEKNTRYYVAADYLGQAGVVRNSRLSRYSLRTNLEQQLNSQLTVGLNLAGSQLNQRQPGYEPDAGPLLRQFLLAPPAVPGRRASSVPTFESGLPGRLLDEGHTPRTRRLLAQLQARYQFTPHLSLRVFGGLERAATNDEYRTDYSSAAALGTLRYQRQETAAVDLTSQVAGAELRYQRTVREQHAFGASLGYLRQQYKQTTSRAMQQEISGQGSSAVGGSEISTRLNTNPTYSPSVGISYVYGGRYEVQASVRADKVVDGPGQLVFSGGLASIGPPEEAYHLFPGGEVRWHAGKEAFLQEVSALSSLSFQAGAGRTSSAFSPDRTTHFDAGLHLGLFRGRLTADATVYERRTTRAQSGVLIPVPGFSYLLISPELDLRSRGMELALSSSWQVGPVEFLSTLAAATNRNQVTRMLEGNVNPALYYQGLEEGQPLGRFLVYAQDGTYPAGSPQAGQVRLRDTNGDGRLNTDDARYQGSGLPRYTLNLYQQVRLQRWQLEAQFDGLFGYQVLNSTFVFLDAPTGTINNSVRALNYWTPANQNTPVPRPGAEAFGSAYQLTDQNLASGNHVRLSQLRLSYEVLNTGPRRASVWVGGQNLFVTGSYRGFDPNVSSSGASPLLAGRDASVYPVARVWQVGVRGSF
ncbi:TonB-dependent receptor plug domain-containing protein [Microvirga sp. STR05]|uniref:TonB-dependent receptor plug domain-containing protein n=1 Tax=Hymenobacter duratus TaxID=2771356 RepID=A0ABR8JET8_9BACT|nr:TonB-dependent receptor plug domain-containing protein [Hymenobacter duratus]MBD2714093.1 TonB-dependent receptor plug domain-containing protein [Hymenobacter duratus]MBR7948995.1 TonB-dependent receptor plug domain-containing protein [Microvirga sp. STR05]